jgi:hypothetical protein
MLPAIRGRHDSVSTATKWRFEENLVVTPEKGRGRWRRTPIRSHSRISQVHFQRDVSRQRCQRSTACGKTQMILAGSWARSPASSPLLRTVHGSFDPHGSSLCKGIFRHPVSQNCISGRLTISTAIEMVHLKVACGMRPALGSLHIHNMTNIPGGALCDGFLADRTHAILPSPNTVKLRTAF